jgi:Uri superfamily endonuclease
MRSSPGVYVLVVFLPNPVEVNAKSFGHLFLEAGHYLYCGSAQAGLLPRLARHMRPDKKRHWHIDSLTNEGEVIGALTLDGPKTTECLLAQILSGLPGVTPVGRGFGSSDCRCPTHLFRVDSDESLSMALNIIRVSFFEEAGSGQSI